MNFETLQSAVEKIIGPLRRKVASMVLRGSVSGDLTDDSLQKVQINGLADETLDGLEYIEPYGFTSKPGVGAETVTLFLNGNRDHGVILSIADRRYRLKGLASDDVALYHKDGTKIVLKGSGKIQIFNPDGNELIAVLSELMTFLENARTTTAMGAQPLFDITGTDTLPAIKAKIDSFKV